MPNRQIVIAELPKGPLTQDHFRTRTVAMPEPGDGEVLLRTILMSIDAANRSWMQGATYRDAVNPGDAMPTYGICEVVESNSARVKVGDIVAAETTWSDYLACPAHKVQKLPELRPLSHLMSVYGIAGKTAFHGLIGVGRPIAGETILVSAAAGSVGGLVGQIAKALGCRVVGIAGGAEKCEWVTQTLGFDACVDHRSPTLASDLKAACPQGIDVYFENVGGDTLRAALPLLNDFARVPLCGVIAWYDGDRSAQPLLAAELMSTLLVKRVEIRAFIILDQYPDHYAGFARDMSAWVGDGKVKIREDVVEGLEQAPAAFIGMLQGKNFGKALVRVAAD